MAKKDSKAILFIIILVVAVIVISQIGIFKPSSGKTEVPKGTTQGGLSLTACVSDSKGNCISKDNTFAVVTFFGEDPSPGARWVTIKSTMIAGGTAPYINVEDVTGSTIPAAVSPDIYDAGIEGQMDTGFQLNNGNSDVQQVVFDITDDRVDFGTTEYKMTVLASFDDADGNRVVLTGLNEPVATVNIDKSVDICWPTDQGSAGYGDSTPWNDCSPTKPKFCQAGTLEDDTAVPPTIYTPGLLIYKASECGCPAGEEPNPETKTSPSNSFDSFFSPPRVVIGLDWTIKISFPSIANSISCGFL